MGDRSFKIEFPVDGKVGDVTHLRQTEGPGGVVFGFSARCSLAGEAGSGGEAAVVSPAAPGTVLPAQPQGGGPASQLAGGCPGLYLCL